MKMKKSARRLKYMTLDPKTVSVDIIDGELIDTGDDMFRFRGVVRINRKKVSVDWPMAAWRRPEIVEEK